MAFASIVRRLQKRGGLTKFANQRQILLLPSRKCPLGSSECNASGCMDPINQLAKELVIHGLRCIKNCGRILKVVDMAERPLQNQRLSIGECYIESAGDFMMKIIRKRRNRGVY